MAVESVKLCNYRCGSTKYINSLQQLKWVSHSIAGDFHRIRWSRQRQRLKLFSSSDACTHRSFYSAPQS